MLDPNLFTVLTAFHKLNLAREVFALPENAHFYRKAKESIAQEPMIDSREPTPAPQPPSKANHESGHCILLHLNNPLKDPKIGWAIWHQSACLRYFWDTKGLKVSAVANSTSLLQTNFM